MSEYEILYSALNLSHEDFSGLFSNKAEAEMLRPELESVIEISERLIKPQGIISIFDAVEVNVDGFRVEDVYFECGRKIAGLLRGSEKIAVFVCTIGAEIVSAYKRSTASGDWLRAYFFDTLGSLAVERTMDIIQKQLKKELSENNLRMTNRFSPGYCNWLVKEQKKLFSLLPHTPCNIQLSESALMIPSKSISGIIGIGSSVRLVEHSCSLCGMKNCLYKKKLHRIE
ncbi:vitamin B12 dependent-methionine synthase activation domain-containing protein [Bacteroides nordii]